MPLNFQPDLKDNCRTIIFWAMRVQNTSGRTVVKYGNKTYLFTFLSLTVMRWNINQSSSSSNFHRKFPHQSFNLRLIITFERLKGQTDIFINYSIPTDCFANQGLNGKDGPITFGTSTTPVRITPMSSHWWRGCDHRGLHEGQCLIIFSQFEAFFWGVAPIKSNILIHLIFKCLPILLWWK